MNATQLPLAPHNGTETSRIAASMVKVSHQERMVLAAIDRHGGLTQDQIEYWTGLLRSAVAGRCNRLGFKGLIRKDGTRLTRYGRPAAVYVLAGSLPEAAHGSTESPPLSKVWDSTASV